MCGTFLSRISNGQSGFILSKHSAPAEGWQHHKVATVRCYLFHLPGKVVRHAAAWVLKIAKSEFELFRTIGEKSFKLAVASAPDKKATVKGNSSAHIQRRGIT